MLRVQLYVQFGKIPTAGMPILAGSPEITGTPILMAGTLTITAGSLTGTPTHVNGGVYIVYFQPAMALRPVKIIFWTSGQVDLSTDKFTLHDGDVEETVKSKVSETSEVSLGMCTKSDFDPCVRAVTGAIDNSVSIQSPCNPSKNVEAGRPKKPPALTLNAYAKAWTPGEWWLSSSKAVVGGPQTTYDPVLVKQTPNGHSVAVDSVVDVAGPVPVIRTAHGQGVVEGADVYGSIEAHARSTVNSVDQSCGRRALDSDCFVVIEDNFKSVEAKARSTVDAVDQSRSCCAPDLVAAEVVEFFGASSRCSIPEGNALQLVSDNSAGCNPECNPGYVNGASRICDGVVVSDVRVETAETVEAQARPTVEKFDQSRSRCAPEVGQCCFAVGQGGCRRYEVSEPCSVVNNQSVPDGFFGK